jgi:hypothetical protein
MNIKTLDHCIICLDIDTVNQKLYSLPCHCNAYIHKDCFQKIDEDNCIICHQINSYSDENKELKIVKNLQNNKHINIEIDDTSDIQPKKCKKITNYLTKNLKIIKLKCKEVFNSELYRGCHSLTSFTMYIIGYIIITYLMGLIFRFVGCFLNRVSLEKVFNDFSPFYHILCTFLVGLFLQILIGMCSCCFKGEDEIYD